MPPKVQRKIFDADGHVAEDSRAIIARMPEAYREEARVSTTPAKFTNP